MSNENNHEFKVTITQEKLVDILLHAATREDIARLDTKLREDIARLDTKFDAIHAATREDTAKLDTKYEARFNKIDARFDKVDARFDRLEAKHDKIVWGIVIAILTPITTQVILPFIK